MNQRPFVRLAQSLHSQVRRRELAPLLAGLAILVLITEARAVMINVTYTANWNNVNNWPGATPAEKAMNQANATMNVNQAKLNWEASITDAFTLDVTVDWGIPVVFGTPSSQVCGAGGVATSMMGMDGNMKPRTGNITFNSALGNWFFDPTPLDHSEYDAVPNEPWRGTAKPAGDAAGKVDLLSCAKHEFGHTLGFHRDPMAGQFVPYIAETADGDIDLNDFAGIAIPVGALGNNNAASHYDPGAGMVPGTLIPIAHLLMVPEAGPAGDDRVVQSPYDISGVAKILGLPLGGAYNLAGKGVVVPEPSTAALLIAGAFAVIRRRR